MKIITVLLVIFFVSYAISTDDQFPKDFMFGVSTAAYQVEGAWKDDGKGESIWDRLVHEHPEVIKCGSNADIACNSYYKYKEDIELTKKLNAKVFRFSIAWTRIAPNGDVSTLNPKGIDHYNCVINEIIANGLTPMATIYHWDLPQYLQELGGWTNPIMSDYLREYARVVFTYYGDRVKYWITINEPLQTCKGYGSKLYAPYLNLNNTGYYWAAYTQILGHAKVYRLYEEEFKSKQQGQVSISVDGVWYMPKDASSFDDMCTAERANQFERGIFSHPIYIGDFPPVVREWVDKKSKKEGRPWSTLPKFTKDEIILIKGTADFYAMNHYSSRLVTRGIDPNPQKFNVDAEYITSVDPSWPTSPFAPWIYVVPSGLRQLLVWLKNQYGNPPLVITENGYGDNGVLNDLDRINYLKGYLDATLQAIKVDKCNVIGYTVWSLLDNFEWMNAYTIHFGLVSVNFSDPERPRITKESYKFFQNVVTTRKLA
ncbi:Glycosyl hydrolases family 1, N-terminal conserved site,Glycoside hydrolase family 1,Glycoside [Cinara cedri]|uniref:Glycosyl hydrolases family 1, N-terminal conserved site,Glycoside hydrolase family 1,Glycoside n=1 Tax=Cinara cedri TaxID=506608 RepID=A0A5E4MB77_9HEMI|nr:Glycosyl hydrolases family 1, N-terminal conserved site,Glycoside hydrolase family 1,Glycoside [Cinara cedri]